MTGSEITSGVLDIFYKNTKEQYAHMPFNNLIQEGKDLLVRCMDGLYEVGSFTIHASDVLKVDISKKKRMAIFQTHKFYIVMAAI